MVTAEAGSACTFQAAPPIISLQNSIVSGNTSANGRDDVSISPYYSSLTVNNSAIGTPTGFTFSGTSAQQSAVRRDAQSATARQQRRSDADDRTGRRVSGDRCRPTTFPAWRIDQRGPGFVRVSGSACRYRRLRGSSRDGADGDRNLGQRRGAAAFARDDCRCDIQHGQSPLPAPSRNAFTLTRNGGGALGGFNATANVVGGVTVVTLNNFTGGRNRVWFSGRRPIYADGARQPGQRRRRQHGQQCHLHTTRKASSASSATSTAIKPSTASTSAFSGTPSERKPAIRII